MIVVKLMGGLGNQMFQYAAGRALAMKHRTHLVLDITGFENMHPDDTPRHYELECYDHRASIASENTLSRVRQPGHKPGIIERLARHFLASGPIFSYGEPPKKNLREFHQLQNNTNIIGWWQDERYFSSIRSALLDEFIPIETGKSCDKYKKLISETHDPVSLHVRRGDYVTNPSAAKHHGLVPVKYYKAAMRHIEDKTDNPTFFIFSDDIAWCKQNLNTKNVVYVEDTKAGHEDMYLMSLCKHNIIANSSFSWWGAWLNKNPQKIVICPKIWFQDQASNDNVTIVPSRWIKL